MTKTPKMAQVSAKKTKKTFSTAGGGGLKILKPRNQEKTPSKIATVTKLQRLPNCNDYKIVTITKWSRPDFLRKPLAPTSYSKIRSYKKGLFLYNKT